MWITRISAAVKSEGMNYSRFVNGLKKAGITINRKMLSEIAIHDMPAFRELVNQAKGALK
jgi:large subunit ribosomal protein L20